MRTLWLRTLFLGVASLLRAQPESNTLQEKIAKAHELLHRNQSKDAIALLEVLASQQPGLTGVQHELGVAYYRSGKLAKAKDAFALAMHEDSADTESVQMEGLVLYRLGQPLAAIPYLERAQAWTPNANADANYVLGLCYMDLQRYPDARSSFARQYDEQPESAHAYLVLATMLKHANLQELAAQQAKKALQIAASLPMAHFLLGEVALFKSNPDEAIVELEAERRVNPTYAPLYDRLGLAYFTLDRLAEAKQVLRKAISLDSGNAGPFILMGRIFLRELDPPTAMLYLRHAVKMDPNSFVTHTLLAQAYHRMGQEEEAKLEMAIASKIHLEDQPQPDLKK